MRPSGLAVQFNHRRFLIGTVVTFLIACASHPALAAITASGNNSSNPTTSGANPIIGISDFGRLTVTAGSSVTSNDAILGDLATGYGIVTITDFNSGTGSTSTWTTKSLMVGDAGTGLLEIQSGAIVTVDYAGAPGTGDFVVGNAADSIGEVTVSGLGSMLRLGDDTVIGQLGTGTLRIADNGYVLGANFAPSDADIFTIGLHGRLELSGGGRLRTDQFANHGAIVGSGRLDSVGTITNSPTGHIDMAAGDRLVVNAVVDNDGIMAIGGGEIEFYKAVTNSGATAELILRDHGTARFPIVGFGFDSTAGVLASTAGTNDIYGTVRIQSAGSKISASGGSTLVFHDPVTNSGGMIEVFAGSSIVYLQGLTATGSGSRLAVNLTDSETTPGSQPIEVTGNVQLAGGLAITLAAGYTPSAGDNFEILSAAGNVTGTLNVAAAPTLPGGMQWNVDVNASNVSVSVVATGDFDSNGIVDASDYVVWRKSLGQHGDGLAADATGDGAVDVADYNFWRARLGTIVTPGSGLGGGAAVPEPTTLVLSLVAMILALNRRRSQ
jgi:T5SS/PEP-CTERM-associated repeat protein